MKHGHLLFFQQDIRNFYVKMRKMHAVNDAMDLLQFCKVAKERNSKFQYAFTTNEEKMLEHIFGYTLIVLIGTKNMEMWLFFILLTR